MEAPRRNNGVLFVCTHNSARSRMAPASTPTTPPAMNVHQLRALLRDHPDASLRFLLPGGEAVPAHFHATEVGRVAKDFLDCGGTRRSTEACVLQLWVDDAEPDHRLRAGKLGRIFGAAAPLFAGGGEGLPVEVEHDPGVLTRYALAGVEASPERIVFRLRGRHAACLAIETCGVAAPKTGATADAAGCCGPAGCCTPAPAGGGR